MKLASEGKVFVAENRMVAEPQYFTKFVKETFLTAPGAWIFPRRSSLASTFGEMLLRLMDTGLMEKMNDDASQPRRLELIYGEKYQSYLRFDYQKSRPQNEPLTMRQFTACLLLLGVGLSVAILVFGFEYMAVIKINLA